MCKNDDARKTSLLSGLFVCCVVDRFADEYDTEIDDPIIHKHIPFAILLIKAAEQWRNTHGGSLPSTSKEKAEFKVISDLVEIGSFLLNCLVFIIEWGCAI